MRDLLNLIRSMLLGLFRSKTSLEAEILALRHQLNVLRRASPQRPVFSNFDRMNPRLLVSDRAAYSGRHHDRGAGNGYPVASGRLSLLLALEIASASRQAEHNAGNSAADPPDEPRQSALGRSPHSWRAPPARYRHRPDLRCEVHGTAKAPSIARLENVPPKSCRRDCLDRPVRGSDALISAAIRIARSPTRPAANYVDWRHRASHCRMDRSPNHRGLRLGGSADLSGSRSGLRLRRGIYPTPSSDGHSRQTDSAEPSFLHLVGAKRRKL